MFKVNPTYRFPILGSRCDYRYCEDFLGDFCYPWEGLNKITPQFFCCEPCKDAEKQMQLREMDMWVSILCH